MDNLKAADAIEAAYWEGYDNYDTPACAYTNSETAWQQSEAKMICDSLRGIMGPNLPED